MHISEVEALVGLRAKNIRYYEDVGLIKPLRDNQNDYRIYSEEDVNKLKTIKFLRELNVPIKEISQLFSGQITLKECMSGRIDKINELLNHYKKVNDMCNSIINNNDSIEMLDINRYFVEMNILNKEGFTMRDVKSSNYKKIYGAVISSSIFSLFFIFIISVISYFQFTEAERMPWFLYIGFVVMLLVPLIGIFYNLFIRIKEIKGGEEDEASKY